MISPKTRLLRDKSAAREMADLLSGPTAEHAVEVAWGQFCYDLPTGPDSDLKRRGAKEFIDVLLSIATDKPPTPPSAIPRLNP